MIPPIPTGSVITIEPAGSGYALGWQNPHPEGMMGRLGGAAFLIFWLCGWAVGETFVIFALIRGKMPWPVKLFMVAWLGGWTVGGMAAIAEVRRLLKKPLPDRLWLERDRLVWQPGSGNQTSNPARRIRSLFSRGVQKREMDIPKGEVTNIQLDRDQSRQRLTFDRGADRIEIGVFLREPEREWVYQVLTAWKESVS